MPTTFHEVMDFHPANQDVYSEIKANLDQLLPFVGAGLTADVYATWGDSLKALGSKLTDPSTASVLKELLKAGEYLDAADLITEKRGELNVARDLVKYFSMSKLDDNWDSIKRGPVWLLPDLFRCPVLTTNFDLAIEAVYLRRGIAPYPTLDPMSHELRAQALHLMNGPCVFKLHGTVSGTMIDTERIVFTGAQYDKHYGLGGDVREALRDFVDSRALLFLGCSLEKDVTVDVLREMAGPDVTHYAIASCKPKERDIRVKELADMGIRAIVYEDGRHDSVRVILERLLEETDPGAYHLLAHKQSALTPYETYNPYAYDSGMTPLFGRTREMSLLKEFVTSTDDDFRWWVLTGPGGIGKSRLALELQRYVESIPGWATYKLDPYDYENLATLLGSFRQKTLVIADYAQAHLRELGKCMGQLATRPHTSVLRLLLVEREGTSISSYDSRNDWPMRLLRAAAETEDKLRARLWSDGFLSLEQLTDDSLIHIVESFSSALKKNRPNQYPHRLPTEEERKEIVSSLKEVDPGLCRPLYALFLTDAWMTGKDVYSWDPERVLNYVLARERKRLYVLATYVLIDEECGEAVCAACASMQRVSTALFGVTLGDIRKMCSEEWDLLSRAAKEKWIGDAEHLLRRLGLVRNDVLMPIEPDLVGEYTVYTWLCCQANDMQRNSFLSRVWSYTLATSQFFDFLLHDYRHLLNENQDRWLRVLPPRERLASSSTNDDLPVALLLANASAFSSHKSIREEVADLLLLMLQNNQSSIEIAIATARGLLNLTCVQDATEIDNTILKLAELHKHNTDRRIAIRLAKALFNRTKLVESIPLSDTVFDSTLQDLTQEYKDDTEIASIITQCRLSLARSSDECAGCSVEADSHTRIVNSSFANAIARAKLNNPIMVNAPRPVAELLSRMDKPENELGIALIDHLRNISSRRGFNTSRDNSDRGGREENHNKP